MIITLNEYTLALLCGGVSCITYILLHFNDIKENDLTSKSKKKVKEETSEDSIISSSETCNMSRRQSQLAARFRAKRAESIKNEHVIFADEFNDDDEKYTPNTAIHDSEVEGILQNTEGGVDVEKIGNFEVPSLNTFDKSQPLDDLLIRRRSLHSSPANSRSGSRSGSVRISAPDDDGIDSEEDENPAEAPEDAQDLQVKNLKSQIASLQNDLSQKSTETSRLESLLKVALSKIHPDKVHHLDDKDEKLWQEYVNLQ